ncbi:hypothetical protein [Sulfitobacter sp. M22]|uniref:hypothetical protein n=1 Tax=Sulfitobacter sp. M22 TaxID=2675332 RepID=UPI001F4834EB|nr:hypothetical protein [Sulfitobacter sp. M22]MCF7725792.1 hypothetical protein [Sulfitobacter sp. M22]
MSIIENSDRGITLNKGLAWTVGTGLIGAGLYVGLTIASLTTAVDNQNEQISEARQSRNGIELRVRVLENTAAGTEVQFRNLSSGLEEVKAAQRETNTLLRQLVRP